jgi:hypothetical protein
MDVPIPFSELGYSPTTDALIRCSPMDEAHVPIRARMQPRTKPHAALGPKMLPHGMAEPHAALKVKL